MIEEKNEKNRMLLSICNLNAWYAKGKNVLSGLSIDLGEHETVGLIGLNGAGKTTLIKVLSGLLDTFCAEEVRFGVHGAEFSSGRSNGSITEPMASFVSFNRGEDIQKKDRKNGFHNEKFKTCRYTVFSEDYSFAYFTFREYLSYVCRAYGREVPDVTELIQGFGFEQFADVLIRDLSTGNRKKVFLITAFALRPPLLLLDEPVNGLDFMSTEYLYRQISDYRRYGTVLFSSHILESITLTSDRVLVLEGGQIRQTFEQGQIDAENMREVLRDETDDQGIC